MFGDHGVFGSPGNDGAHAAIDVIPYQLALRRLLRASVCREEQLYDYGLSQSMRSLFFAVQSTQLPVYSGVEQACTHDAHCTEEDCTLISSSHDMYTNTDNDGHSIEGQQQRKHCPDSSLQRSTQLHAPGKEAVLYLMCREATESIDNLRCLIYLSVRLLCDAASHYGRGNDRPCVTVQWSDALLSFIDGSIATVVNKHAPRMRARRAMDRQYQLGYIMLLTGTLRELARGAVADENSNTAATPEVARMQHTRQHLFRHHLALASKCMTELLPRIAILTEQPAGRVLPSPSASIVQQHAPPLPHNLAGKQASVSQHDAAIQPAPSRLAMEANHCILHVTHWLCADAIAVHLCTEADGGGSDVQRSMADSAAASYPTRSCVSGVLDRDAPQQLWQLVTLVRSAITRLIRWVTEEASQALPVPVCHGSLSHMQADRKQDPLHAQQQTQSSQSQLHQCIPQGNNRYADYERRGLRLVHDTTRQLQELMSSWLHAYEQVSCARTAAVRCYGDSASDVHALSTMMWSRTVQLCVSLHDITQVCMRVHGGCGLEHLSGSSGDVLRGDGDVMSAMASALMHLPTAEEEGVSSSSGALWSRSSSTTTYSSSTSSAAKMNDSIAAETLLRMALTIALAAPLSSMQRALWCAEPELTQHVHELLVQRGLRYKDERVLKLSAMLMGSVWHSSTAAAPSQTHGSTSYDNGSDASVGNDYVGGVTMGRWVSESSEQLLELLAHSRDAAAHCVVDMLTLAVVEQPTHLIPALFRILRHGDLTARRNALDVLSALPQLVPHASHRTTQTAATKSEPTARDATTSTRTRSLTAESAYAEAYSDARSEDSAAQGGSLPLRRVLQLLATHLLLQLHDGELRVRMHAAALFAKVHPEDAMAPLLHLYIQQQQQQQCHSDDIDDSTHYDSGSVRKGRHDDAAAQRAAVQSALMTVVSTHAQEGAAVMLLVWRVVETMCAALPDARSSSSSSMCMRDGASATDSASRTCEQTQRHEQWTSWDDVGDREDALGSKAVENKGWVRPVPHAPGDILPHAMLYGIAPLSSDERTESDPGCSGAGTWSSSVARDGAEEAERGDLRDVARGAGHAGPPRAEGRARLGRLTELLGRCWADHVTDWTVAGHVAPLLRHVRDRASSHLQCSEGKSSTSAERQDEVQQWRVRCLLHLLQYATSLHSRKATPVMPASTAELAHDQNEIVMQRRVRQCRRVCHSALWQTFFAPVSPVLADDQSGEPAPLAGLTWTACCDDRYASSPWLQRLLLPRRAFDDNADRVFATVFPLLCVRACSLSAVYHDSRSNTTMGENGDDGDGTERDWVEGGIDDADSNNNTSSADVCSRTEADKTRFNTQVHPVLTLLWHAAVCHSTAPLFLAAPEVIRLVLELLCDMPAVVLFQRLDAAGCGVRHPSRATNKATLHTDCATGMDQPTQHAALVCDTDGNKREVHDECAVSAVGPVTRMGNDSECESPVSGVLSRLSFFALCRYLSTMPGVLCRQGACRFCVATTGGQAEEKCAMQAGNSRRVLLQRSIDAFRQVECDILPWLACEDEEEHNGRSPATADVCARAQAKEDEATRHKLSRLGVDLVALVTIHRLWDETNRTECSAPLSPAHVSAMQQGRMDGCAVHPQHADPAKEPCASVDHVEEEDLTSELWQRHRDVALLPLISLAQSYRATSSKGNTTSANINSIHDSGSDGALSLSSFTRHDTRGACVCADSLARFQLCVHVHYRVLAMLRTTASTPTASPTHGIGSRSSSADAALMWLRWFHNYLPALMELANAACAVPTRGAAKSSASSVSMTCWRVACECCELLFRAVVYAARSFTAQPSTSSTGTRAEIESTPTNASLASPLLQRLPYVDKVALMQFALGSARYGTCVELQKIGVRLLSALVAAAPEMLTSVPTSSSETDTATVKVGMVKPEGGDCDDAVRGMLQEASYVLRSVAHMHSDPATRTLAECVLQALTVNETPE